MATNKNANIESDVLIAGLRQPDAYPNSITDEIEVQETHISIVFLAGDFAYKVKKSVRTDFLDYSTLDLRRHHCEEEVRLDGRYANDMYIGVVPISWENGHLRFEGDEHPVEYAVKMRRFPKDALLSERLKSGKLSTSEVCQLADTIASFHRNAAVCNPQFAAGWSGFLSENLEQILVALQSTSDQESGTTLNVLRIWKDKYFGEEIQTLVLRERDGFIRECHGDLHLQNVVHWDDRLVPFDGIEFNERLRWIDVLADAAFLAMDLAYRGHLDLSRTFMNAYLEHSGDYESLKILRVFLVYRSIVRALVSKMRSEQSQVTLREREDALLDAREHIALAYRFTLRESPSVWITHGFSGSGKTTLSEAIVQRHEAFRLRSDVERKRLFGLLPAERPTAELQAKMYSEEANEQTYLRLVDLTRAILHAGYSVVVDATFLKSRDRGRFQTMARQEGVPFAILDCHSDKQTLRQRVSDRMANRRDASDADVRVLEHQFATHQPLTEAELRCVVHIPELAQIAQGL